MWLSNFTVTTVENVVFTRNSGAQADLSEVVATLREHLLSAAPLLVYRRSPNVFLTKRPSLAIVFGNLNPRSEIPFLIFGVSRSR
jgi:hypothetical protein